MNIIKGSTKGFTLLELIIVIGIIAILGTVSVLVLNPAQLFAQARDTTRISDLATLNNAINLYMTDVSAPDLDGTIAAFTCGTTWGGSLAGATQAFLTAHSGGLVQAGIRTTGGAGWVPVNFGSMTGNSPIATLPIDPTNSGAYDYQYSCATGAVTTYELDANLESTKYANGGTNDRESTDGGDVSTEYEVGTALTL